MSLLCYFSLFFSVKAITKLNLGQGETFEIKIKKNGRRGSRSLDNAKFGHFANVTQTFQSAEFNLELNLKSFLSVANLARHEYIYSRVKSSALIRSDCRSDWFSGSMRRQLSLDPLSPRA